MLQKTLINKFKKKYEEYRITQSEEDLKKLLELTFQVTGVPACYQDKTIMKNCINVVMEGYKKLNDKSLGNLALNVLSGLSDKLFKKQKIEFAKYILDNEKEVDHLVCRAHAIFAEYYFHIDKEKAYYHASCGYAKQIEPHCALYLYKLLKLNYPIPFDTKLAIAYLEDFLDHVKDCDHVPHTKYFLELNEMYESFADDFYVHRQLHILRNAKEAYSIHDSISGFSKKTMVNKLYAISESLLQRLPMYERKIFESDDLTQLDEEDDYFYYDDVEYFDPELFANTASILDFMEMAERGELPPEVEQNFKELLKRFSPEELEAIRNLADDSDDEHLLS